MSQDQDAIIRKHAKISLKAFIKDPDDPELNTHPLQNVWKGYFSIDVDENPDWKLIFEEIEDGTIAHFVAAGTHDTLYRKQDLIKMVIKRRGVK